MSMPRTGTWWRPVFRPVKPPHDTGNNNRNALLRDPDGNLVEIVAKRAAR